MNNLSPEIQKQFGLVKTKFEKYIRTRIRDYFTKRGCENEELFNDIEQIVFIKIFKLLKKTPDKEFNKEYIRLTVNSVIVDCFREQANQIKTLSCTQEDGTEIESLYIATKGDLLDNLAKEEKYKETEKELKKLEESQSKCQDYNKRLVIELGGKLQSRYRTILEYYYLDNLKYREISEKLNCKIGTVKSKLARAREVFYNKTGKKLNVKQHSSINKKNNDTQKGDFKRNIKDLTRKEVKEIALLYFKNNISSSELSKKYKIRESKIEKLLYKFKIIRKLKCNFAFKQYKLKSILNKHKKD